MELNELKNPPGTLAAGEGKKLYISDLQIHSRFARATSKNITIDNLVKWARIKGLNLMGTGDFQHPKWNAEIKEKLEEDGKGILWLRDGNRDVAFLWRT